MTRLRLCALSTTLLALTVCAPAAASVDAEPDAPRAEAHDAPAVAPVTPPADVLAKLRGEDRERPAPKEEPAEIDVEGKEAGSVTQQGVGTASTPFWSWGVTKYQSGLNCSIVDMPYYETQVTSQVGYGGTASVPKVGERFNVVLLYSHPGYACSGGFLADLYTELGLPEGTALAIDQTHGIGCYTTTRTDPDTWVDVTRSTWSSPNGTRGNWCKTDGARGKFGGINVGFRMLVTGTMFQIVVPVIATKELKGAAHVPTVAEFIGATESVVTTSRTAFPSVWANVLGFFAPSISYPAPSASQISQTGARTTAYVYNRFRTGNAYLDLGTSTAYGQSSAAFPLGSNDAYTINATWNTLKPARRYHWRARFVAADGTVTNGPDQEFLTPPGATVNRNGASIAVRSYGRLNDNLRVGFSGGRYRFTNPSSPLIPGPGCDAITANEVTCDGAGVTGLNLDTGFSDDVVTIDPSVTVATNVLAGDGNDRVTGGGGRDTIDGGNGADTMLGGGGSDVVSYKLRKPGEPVTVTLEGAANDGGALDLSGTVRDNVGLDVERVNGGRGADTLTGNDQDNAFKGGGGADKLIGNGGTDRLEADDDAADVTIDCGAGTGEKAFVDTTLDPATAGCESVYRS